MLQLMNSKNLKNSMNALTNEQQNQKYSLKAIKVAKEV